MHLWLADRLQRDPMFFREAHLVRFQRIVDTKSDELAFKICGIIPEYVREYVETVQRKEAEDARNPAGVTAR